MNYIFSTTIYKNQFNIYIFVILLNMAGFVVPFVFFTGIAGLIWAIYNYKKLSDVNVKPIE